MDKVVSREVAQAVDVYRIAFERNAVAITALETTEARVLEAKDAYVAANRALSEARATLLQAVAQPEKA
jgi:outer membrane protein TolC